MNRCLLLNGPNLNLLGSREPKHYGPASLADIELKLKTLAETESIELVCKQSNSEGELVDMIQAAALDDIQFIIFNAAAYTHTSIAIRDALLAVNIPFIEVHLSNVHQREPFRHHSYLSDIAKGIITGLGSYGYELALLAAIEHIRQ